MKRSLFFVLVLLLALSLVFSACGPASGGTPNPPSSNNTGNSDGSGNSGNSGSSGNSDDGSDNPPAIIEPEKSSRGLEYSSYDGICIVRSIGSCTDTEIVIPSASANGDPVTTIFANAFQDCETITSVSVPDSVTEIQANAFAGCTALQFTSYQGADYLGNEKNPYHALIKATDTSITSCAIHENTKVVASGAFQGCANLASVTFADNVIALGAGAFDGCTALAFTSDQGANYLGTATNPYFALVSVEGSACTVHEDVKVLALGVFAGNKSLTSITLPEGIAKITNGMFQDCNKLESFTVPASVTSIDSYAFDGCSKLTSVTLAEGTLLERIGECVFNRCPQLQFSEYSWGKYLGTQSNPYYAFVKNKKQDMEFCDIHSDTILIADSSFSDCSSLKNIAIPESTLYIGNSAFAYCEALKRIIGGANLKTIGAFAFQSCGKLNDISTLSNTITAVGEGAFGGCNSLMTIRVEYGNPVYHSAGNCLIETASKTLVVGCAASAIPDDGSVTKIGNRAFYYCSDLQTVTIPAGVTEIGAYAFRGCSKLESMTLPDSVTSIGESAFENCYNLESVNIPNGVTEIANSTFYSCNKLSAITLPASLTAIGKNAFTSCSALESILIPENVTSIGAEAFRECHALRSVDIRGNITAIEEGTFRYCIVLDTFTIPSGVVTVATKAFDHCVGLSGISIAKTVKSIASWAFEECGALVTINFRGTADEWESIEKGVSWNYNTGNYTVRCSDNTEIPKS